MIENIKIALTSVRSNLLRTVLTIFIIAIGISALVGIQTAIESIKSSINDNFTNMGANTFTIRNKNGNIKVGKKGTKAKRYPAITYAEAVKFKETFHTTTSLATIATGMGVIKSKSKKTDPNIRVMGVDENYLTTSGYVLASGRNMNEEEALNGRNVALIGMEVKNNIFGEQNATGELITIGSNKYRVIGVLEEKGSSMSFGGDKNCLIPINNSRQYFGYANQAFTISSISEGSEMLETAVSEATARMRITRRLKPSEENNFDVVRSDNLAQTLISNIRYVSLAATIIGIITLLGSAIGLMNIMLVSVTERTKEIGVRKALGATPKIIKKQFLIEAIVICQLGGIAGIIFGISVGNVTSLFTGGGFIIPWLWITYGIILCIIVGLVSGIFPAIKAANLDPIESLRYE